MGLFALFLCPTTLPWPLSFSRLSRLCGSHPIAGRFRRRGRTVVPKGIRQGRIQGGGHGGPFGGPPDFIKRERKRCACACKKAAFLYLTVTRTPHPPPLSEILYPPLIRTDTPTPPCYVTRYPSPSPLITSLSGQPHPTPPHPPS